MIRIVVAAALAFLAATEADARMEAREGWVRGPEAWYDFCHRHPEDCEASRLLRPVHLSADRMAEIERVNKEVNDSIEAMTDRQMHGVEDYWSYPDQGVGDCEDYVLLKRKRLVEKGWPMAALMITVVLDDRGDGHAILTVRTDGGDFVLDNMAEDVLHWRETGYRFIKRLSTQVPNQWVRIREGDARAVASAGEIQPED